MVQGPRHKLCFGAHRIHFSSFLHSQQSKRDCMAQVIDNSVLHGVVAVGKFGLDYYRVKSLYQPKEHLAESLSEHCVWVQSEVCHLQMSSS